MALGPTDQRRKGVLVTNPGAKDQPLLTRRAGRAWGALLGGLAIWHGAMRPAAGGWVNLGATDQSLIMQHVGWGGSLADEL